MYLNSGLEGEEALYMASDDGFYRLRGYCVYYERNQMMQDYMIARKDVKRVDAGVDDGVIRDFRRRMDEKREEARERRSAVSVLGGICGVLSVAVLAGGIVMVNNYQKMRDMESVLASVMPAGAEYLPGGEEEKPELVLETGVTVQPETMTAGMPEQPETGAAASEPVETGAAVSEPAASGTAEAVSGEAASKPAETGTAAAEPSKTGAAASEPAASGAAEAVSGEAEAVHIPSLEEADQQMEVLGQALEEASTHVVQDGETLYGICLEKYHDLSRVDEVCRLNGLEDVNKIKAGQKLILP